MLRIYRNRNTRLVFQIFFSVIIISQNAFAAKKYSAVELQQLASSIALYPDTLLKDLLPAATFPEQITDAALLIQDKSDADLIKSQSWDTSVKIIATYPGVLKMMYQKLIWTTQLGEAFLNQNNELLDAIQVLRSKADKVGNLESDDKRTVSTEKNPSGNTIIKIVPTDPQVIYIPQNTTTVVYSQPVYTSYAAPLVTFGLGMAVGAAMNNHHDNVNVYYGGYYHGNMWHQDSYDDWADVRHDRNEDRHDQVMDRQDATQDRRANKQDFRQDYINDHSGTINHNNFEQLKSNQTAKLNQAKANMNNRKQSYSTAHSSTAFSGMNSGNFSSRASTRGAYSRYGNSGGFNRSSGSINRSSGQARGGRRR